MDTVARNLFIYGICNTQQRRLLLFRTPEVKSSHQVPMVHETTPVSVALSAENVPTNSRSGAVKLALGLGSDQRNHKDYQFTRMWPWRL